MDNDILVSPRWLEALWRCAEETQARLVGPIYCIGNPREQVVHMAGGDAHIEQKGGGRSCTKNTPARSTAPRRTVDFAPRTLRAVEFHCMLARPIYSQVSDLLTSNCSALRSILICVKARHAGAKFTLNPMRL
jgi:hypothetical protein